MAAFTAAQSGNWNDGATWGKTSPGVEGTDYPGASDTATINATCTVTVPTGSSCSCAGLTVGSTTAGSLTVNGTLTMLGDITCSVEGTTLTLGPGSELALSGNNLALNRTTLRSAATSSQWARVTGTGSAIADTSGARTDVVLSYVSFQNTGAITFNASTLGTGITSQIDIDHCCFVGCGAVTFGEGGWTALATNITVDCCDFRDLGGDIKFAGVSTGARTGAFSFSYNTISCATKRTFINQAGDGLSLAGNVYYNLVFGSWTAAGQTISDSYFELPSDAVAGATIIPVSDSRPALTFQGNYLYLTSNNPHPIVPSGSGGSGIHDYSGNVFEVVYNTDGANLVMTGELGCDIYRNLLLGSGALANKVGSGGSGMTVNVYRNTCYAKETSGTNGLLWITENGAHLGTVNIHSNLVSGSVTVSTSCWANVAQAANTVGYNAHDDVTTHYDSDITMGDDQTAHDVNDQDPQFVDASRDLAAWDASLGGAGTEANARGQLLKLNGYSSATKTQSDTPPSGYTPAGLVSWVRAGFVPQNSVYDGAGKDGVDIGAMDVLVAKAGSDTAAVAEAASLIRGRPGQQEAYLGAFGSLAASRPGYLCGYLLSLTQQGQAFLKGSQQAAASQASYADGQAGSLRVEQPALAVGGAAFLGSLPAHAHGVGGAAGEQVVFINAERLYLEVAQPAHAAALSAFEGSQRAQAAGMQQLLASKAAWLRAVWSAASQQPAFLEGVSSLLVASQPAAACAWESAAHHLRAYAVAALPAGRIAFQLGSQQLLLSAGRTYPLREPRERLQVIARSAGGTVRVMDKGVGVRLIRLALAGLGEADHSALTAWFETVAAGALNAFTFVDEAGASHQVRWMGGLNLEQTAPGRWAGEIVLEKVA